MSELKLLNCPFCGGKLEYSFLLGVSECKGCGVMIGFPKLTRHEDKIIATNTRKPMDNIVEKLEESQERYDDVAFMEMSTNGHTLDFEYAHGKKDGVQEAINIVKQEIKNGLE